MGCEPFVIDHGDGKVSRGFICSRGPTRQRRKCAFCGGYATLLCDGPSDREGRTCDAPMCVKCAIHVPGQDVDYCPLHKREAEK